MQLRELYETEAPRAYSFALRLTGDPAAAEDAVAKAFCRAAEAREAVPGRREVLGLVWRCAVDQWRSQRARRAREEGYAMAREARSATREPGAAAETAELARAARGAMGLLSREERAVIALSCEHGLGPDEIADITKMPRETVRSHRRRGLARLRDALAASGFASLAPAALSVALASAPAEELPASFATSLAGKLGLTHSVAAGPTAAVKGGIVMKLIAGIVLAGAVAAGVAMMGGGRGPEPLASPGGKGPPKREHFAFINQLGYLDGPRREAQAGKVPRLGVDAKGDLYFFSAHFYGALRWIQPDGRIVTISGNDYWNSDIKLAEGPASCLGNPYGIRGVSFGLPTGTLVVEGVPDEGAEKGCIYTTDPYKNVVRVFRNKDKEDRWWFERVAGGGKAPTPAKRGEAVAAKEVGFQRMPRLQHDKDGKLVVFVDSGFYHLEHGKLTCLLGPADYGAKGPKNTKTKKVVPVLEGFMGGDGSFYLGYYYSGGGGDGAAIAAIWRVSPDGTRVEPYARDTKKGLTMEDGPALSAGFACGPHMWMINNARYQPPDILFTSAHDESMLRRVRDGRVSSLCKDGEWRELGNRAKERFVGALTWSIGPNGTVYQTQHSFRDIRTWLVTGIDFDKPTVGAKLEGGKP